LADYLRAYEDVTSDANLQVTAVLPQQHNGYIMDMRLFEGFTGEYHGRVKRPVLAYRWRGFLPFEAAYVLVPFRGVRSKPYAGVTGGWSRTGDLSVTVRLPQGSVRVSAKGLRGTKPKPCLLVRASVSSDHSGGPSGQRATQAARSASNCSTRSVGKAGPAGLQACF
jgi:hypothetical protein